MKKIVFTIIIVLATTLLLVFYKQQQTSPISFAGISVLQDTVVTPVDTIPLPPNMNVAYCPSAALAWKQIVGSLTQEPIQMEGSPLLVKELNDCVVNPNAFPEGSTVTYFGEATEKTNDIINSLLASKGNPESNVRFATKEIPFLGSAYDSYAGIFYKTDFLPPFEKGILPFKFINSNVHSFGIPAGNKSDFQEMRKNIQVRYYHRDTNSGFPGKETFIISLGSKNNNVEILLASVQKEQNLKELICKTIEKISVSSPTPVLEDEHVTIPTVRFRFRHSFKEIVHKRILNPSVKDGPCWLDQAIQDVAFSLSEKGVELSDETRMRVIFGAIELNPPRSFVFNEPFLIILKKRDCNNPFFALWIETPSLLEKWASN